MVLIDTHVHTSEVSVCARVGAAEAVRLYKACGYNGFVLTDHYYNSYFKDRPGEPRLSWHSKIEAYLSGYRLAREEGERCGFEVLWGIELRFNNSNNDFLVYGLDEDFLFNYPELYQYTPETFKELVDREGANKILIFQAHPFRPGMVPANGRFLDGIETFNGHPGHESRNHLAAAYAHDNNLLAISGSDFHNREDYPAGGVLLSGKAGNMDGFVRAIKESNYLLYPEQ